MEKKLLELCTKKIVTKTYQKGFRAEKVIKRKGNKYRLNHNARPKKVILFLEIGQVKNFLSLTNLQNRICIRTNIFNIFNNNKKTK